MFFWTMESLLAHEKEKEKDTYFKEKSQN